MRIKEKYKLRVGEIIQIPLKRWNGETAGEYGLVKTTVIVTGVYPDFINTKTENGITYSIQNVDLVKYGIYPRESVLGNTYGFLK